MTTREYLDRQQTLAHKQLLKSMHHLGDELDRRCAVRKLMAHHPWLTLATGLGSGVLTGRWLGGTGRRTRSVGGSMVRVLTWGVSKTLLAS